MKQLTINLTENAHPHAEMIAECIADMNLIVFGKGVVDWFELDVKNVAWWEEGEYFLCLPKHNDACLHWLNGGAIQFKSEFGWIDNHIIDEDIEWTSDCGFMREDYEFRIKPKKEKRWIGVRGDGITTSAFDSQQKAYDALPNCKMDWGIYEIEIEVTA